jgi:uncharacterized alkaline shock family protein YloU
MITLENYLGKTSISDEYLISLINYTAAQCFGVAALNPAESKKNLVSIVKKAKGKGTRSVKMSVDDENRLCVTLHISVLYGTNIAAVTENLAHKIRYTVEDKTGLKISKLSVCVDGMIE